jgi:formate-dependent nitrite reductase membrane component NrfD
MFSLYVVWYLFLAGAGSGAYALAAGFALGGGSKDDRAWKYREISRGGFYLGPILVMLGTVFLIFDLGSPALAYTLFLSPKFTYLTFGSWVVLLFCLLSIGLAFLRTAPRVRVPRLVLKALDLLALLAALCVMGYTGALTSSMPSVPFLHTPLIIVLFVISSFSTGAALITLYGFFNQQRKSMLYGLKIVSWLDLALIVCEIAALVAIILIKYLESDIARESVNLLLMGEARYAFWIGTVVIGMVVPAVASLLVRQSPHMVSQAVSSSAILVGGLALRYSLITAGLHIAFN